MLGGALGLGAGVAAGIFGAPYIFLADSVAIELARVSTITSNTPVWRRRW